MIPSYVKMDNVSILQHTYYFTCSVKSMSPSYPWYVPVISILNLGIIGPTLPVRHLQIGNYSQWFNEENFIWFGLFKIMGFLRYLPSWIGHVISNSKCRLIGPINCNGPLKMSTFKQFSYWGRYLVSFDLSNCLINFHMVTRFCSHG